ncbi:hypothetical protein BC833DRAFT_611738 [Globomyces pollinis-pini]|nr:hypothetical protein BC833DRAFT_611738 [Globomyces pollinis-pini]
MFKRHVGMILEMNNQSRCFASKSKKLQVVYGKQYIKTNPKPIQKTTLLKDEQKHELSKDIDKNPVNVKPMISKMNLEKEKVLNDRVLWFNDSHLFSKKMIQLIQSNEYDMVADLIERHTGVVNDIVFGVVFNELGKKNEHKLVLHYYDLMKSRKIIPTDRGYTCLLNSLYALTIKNQSKDQYFKQGLEIFESTQKSIIHLNSFLKLCVECNQLGYTKGIELYKNITNSTTQPDSQTITHLLRLCSKKGSTSSINYGIQIFEYAESSNLVDEQCLLSYIDLCSISRDTKIHNKGVDTICKYFQLPKSHQDSNMTKSTNEFKMNNQLLTKSIHLLTRMRYPALAQSWYDIVTKRDGIIIDDHTREALASLYLACKQYKLFLEIVDALPFVKSKSLKLRAYSELIGDEPEEMERWVSECQTIYETCKQQEIELNYRDLYNIMIVYQQTKSSQLVEFITRHRLVLIDHTVLMIEESIEQNRRTNGILKLRINGLRVCLKILNGTDNVMLLKRIGFGLDLVSLIPKH